MSDTMAPVAPAPAPQITAPPTVTTAGVGAKINKATLTTGLKAAVAAAARAHLAAVTADVEKLLAEVEADAGYVASEFMADVTAAEGKVKSAFGTFMSNPRYYVPAAIALAVVLAVAIGHAAHLF